MSITITLPADARAELALALAALEHQSLAARLAGMAGTPIEALKRRLPEKAQAMLDNAIRRALETALRAALRSDPSKVPLPVSGNSFHRGLAVLSGAAGGAFGLPGTLVELPISTTLLLRQIAAEAAEAGEDLSRVEVAAECLKVFALGSNDPGDDAVETGYFAARLALAQGVPQLAAQSLNTVLPSFVSAIAARFAGPVTLKLSAQAAPVIGAAAGAAVNLAFLEHFRGVARGHFAVRRLERLYGPVLVREAAAALAAA